MNLKAGGRLRREEDKGKLPGSARKGDQVRSGEVR